MNTDRATLANVLAELETASKRLDTALMSIDTPEGRIAKNSVIQAQMRLYYCQGRLRGLLAEPVERDSVDEANAEAETWD